MKKFEIRTATAQIRTKDRKLIAPYITMNSDILHDLDDKTLESFNTLEDAKKVFKAKYSNTDISRTNNGFYFIQEYWVEEVNYDENGDCIDPWANDPIMWSAFPDEF